MSPFNFYAGLIVVICIAYFYYKLIKLTIFKELDPLKRFVIPLIICLCLFFISSYFKSKFL